MGWCVALCAMLQIPLWALVQFARVKDADSFRLVSLADTNNRNGRSFIRMPFKRNLRRSFHKDRTRCDSNPYETLIDFIPGCTAPVKSLPAIVRLGTIGQEPHAGLAKPHRTQRGRFNGKQNTVEHEPLL